MKKILFAFLTALLIAAAAFAQSSATERFDGTYPLFPIFPTPSIPDRLEFGPMTISGGYVYYNQGDFGPSVVYATEGPFFSPFNDTLTFPCNGCSNQVVIESNRTTPFVSLEFDLIQANSPYFNNLNLTYRISDLNNPSRAITVTLSGPGASKRVRFNGPVKSVMIESPLVKTSTLNPNDPASYYFFAIDNVTWSFGSSVRITTSSGAGPGDDTAAHQDASSDESSNEITYPLGLPFFVQLERQVNGKWQRIPATWSIEDTAPTAGPPPVLSVVQLFPHNHLWFYGGPDGDYKDFQTVHLGTAKIKVTPNDSSISPVTIPLKIIRPDSLGGANAAGGIWDSAIIDVSDQSGIPPQYVKAQAEQESGFNTRSWRYEALSVDYPVLHHGLMSRQPWSDYLLREATGTYGTRLCPTTAPGQPTHDCVFPGLDDIVARSQGPPYLNYSRDNSAPQRIPTDIDGIRPLTIREIYNASWNFYNFDGSDPSPQCGPLARPATGTTGSGHRRAARPPGTTLPCPGDLLAVTAQTPGASSMGLMQIVHTYGVEVNGSTGQRDWPGVDWNQHGDLRFNPALLFDDAISRAFGGGSLRVGVSEDARVYRQENRRSDTDISFKDVLEYEGDRSCNSSTPEQGCLCSGELWWMFKKYNGACSYAAKVYARVPRFMPRTGTPNIGGNGVCVPPAIVLQNGNATVAPGESITIGITLAESEGHEPEVTWFAGSDPTPIGFDRYVTVSPSVTTTYRAQARNACGSVTSAPITVQVAPSCGSLPLITSQPLAVSIARGSSATLSVTASNAASYQWYLGQGPLVSGMDGDRSHPVADSNSPSIQVSPDVTSAYWVEVRNSCGPVFSHTATVTVAECVLPAITAQPNSTSITSGGTATLSVSATGATAYSWSDSNGNIVGTSASIDVSPSVTTSYFCRVSNDCGAVTTNTVTVTVNCTLPSINVQPQSTSVTAGGSTTLSFVATGATSIHWFDGSGNPAGTGASINVSPAATTTYHAVVSNACGSVTSASATVSVVAACTPLVITAQPNPEQTIIPGQSAGFLSVTVTGTNPHYQWYLSDRITGAEFAIGGANISNYLALQPGDYFCRISNDCSSVDSNIGTVLAGVACGPAGVFTVTDDQTVTAGESLTLSVNPSGSAPFDYQWFQVFPDGSKTPIGIGQNMTVTPTAEVSQYSVTVSNRCGSGSSRVITLTLCHPPLITAQPVAPVFTSFNETGTLSVVATGTNLHYTWYANNVAVGSDAPSIPIAPPTIATGYRCTVTGDCGTADSDFIIVNPPCIKPSITQQPVSQNITAGFPATLSLTATGNTPLAVSWFSADGTPAGSGTSINVSPSVTTSYYAVVSNACGSATSDTVTVTVVPGCTAPSITAQPQNVTISQGTSTTLHVTATGDAPLQYQWFSSSGVQVPSGTSASVTVAPLQTQSYYVVVSNGCGSVQSHQVTVTVQCIAPQITSQPPSSVTINRGQIITLSVTATGSLLHYQWFEQFPNESSPHSVVNGTDTTTLTVGGNDTPSGTIYTCKVFNGCGSVTSNPTVLNIQ